MVDRRVVMNRILIEIEIDDDTGLSVMRDNVKQSNSIICAEAECCLLMVRFSRGRGRGKGKCNKYSTRHNSRVNSAF